MLQNDKELFHPLRFSISSQFFKYLRTDVTGYSQLSADSYCRHVRPSFRGGFDFGYNPPLRAGQNVILIELEMDPDLPAEWDFTVVGGIEKLTFL